MVLGDVLARHGRDLLEHWDDHSEATAWTYLVLCIFLVLFAGMMSGLTLGLMSMDIVELEVLRRSGSELEARQAARIIPVVKDAHFLLVTLLLCNAVAMEALPIFLDKIMDSVAAILVSVTAVLFMGEIFPQAVCSKYGLAIGSAMSIPVRVLMLLTSPISFPIAKLLDFVLGGEHASLFRRKQLKALVLLHAKDEGFGGRLTSDEIQIITGALDLTRKTAYHAMTPLDKVFMLSAEQKLDDATVSAVMASKPFSRLPVHRGQDPQDIIGVILVKELLEYVKHFPDSPVSSMKIRQLPRLSADTPMYDLLKLFRVGRSHMALLTQPLAEPSDTSSTQGARMHSPLSTIHESTSQTLSPTGPRPLGSGQVAAQGPDATATHANRDGLSKGQQQLSSEGQASSSMEARAASTPTATKQGLLSSFMSNMGISGGKMDAEETTPMLGGGGSSGTRDGNTPASVFGMYANDVFEPGRAGAGGAKGNRLPMGQQPLCGLPGGATQQAGRAIGNEQAGVGTCAPASMAPGQDLEANYQPAGGSPVPSRSGLRSLFTRDSAAEGPDTDKRSGKGRRKKRSRRRQSSAQPGVASFDGMEMGQVKPGDSDSSSSSSDTSSSGSSRDNLEDMLPVPLIARPGAVIGIITIEDVIEELMGIEILDETDRFVDNEQSIPVNFKGLEADLPDHLRSVLTVAELAKNQVLEQTIDRQSWLLQAAAAVTGGTATAQGSVQHQAGAGTSTSVLAGLAGSMFRHAFGADPLATAMTHVRQHSREKIAGTSPVAGGGPGGGILPKRGGEAGRGQGGAGPAGAAAVSSGGGGVAANVQRSDIRAATAVAAELTTADTVGRSTFANWKRLENLKNLSRGGSARVVVTPGGSGSLPHAIPAHSADAPKGSVGSPPVGGVLASTADTAL